MVGARGRQLSLSRRLEARPQSWSVACWMSRLCLHVGGSMRERVGMAARGTVRQRASGGERARGWSAREANTSALSAVREGNADSSAEAAAARGKTACNGFECVWTTRRRGKRSFYTDATMRTTAAVTTRAVSELGFGLEDGDAAQCWSWIWRWHWVHRRQPRPRARQKPPYFGSRNRWKQARRVRLVAACDRAGWRRRAEIIIGWRPKSLKAGAPPCWPRRGALKARGGVARGGSKMLHVVGGAGRGQGRCRVALEVGRRDFFWPRQVLCCLLCVVVAAHVGAPRFASWRHALAAAGAPSRTVIVAVRVDVRGRVVFVLSRRARWRRRGREQS
jgi:hypothetical protein